MKKITTFVFIVLAWLIAWIKPAFATNPILCQRGEVKLDTPPTEVDITEFVNAVKTNSEKTAKLSETITMNFDELRKLWTAKPDSDITPGTAKLEESLTKTVTSAPGKVVPVAYGGFAAIVLSEVVDGITPKPMYRAVGKSAAAIAVYKWGAKIPGMGTTGKNIAAALLVFDVLRDITPISTWATQVAAKVTGVIPVGGLGDSKGRNVMAQANGVVNSYYARSGWGR